MQTEQIKNKALKVAQRLQAKKIYATSDGNIFRADDKGNPTMNCKNHVQLKKVKLLEFEFSEEELKAVADSEGSNTTTKKEHSKMTNEALLALITERKIELGTANKKADYVALLEAADAAAEVK